MYVQLCIYVVCVRTTTNREGDKCKQTHHPLKVEEEVERGEEEEEEEEEEDE